MTRHQRLFPFAVAVLMLAATPGAPAAAYPRPGRTEFISACRLDCPTKKWPSSTLPSISADGRYVAFKSPQETLVPGDTNSYEDIFVAARETGAMERVSVGHDGAEANGNSSEPSISADGRYVAFLSRATNLVPADDNDLVDVFVHDRLSGQTELVSVSSEGVQTNGAPSTLAISGTGRYVVFSAAATNLVAGPQNRFLEIYLRDRLLGTTERVSVGMDGALANSASYFPRVSDDGRYVAFSSGASNLVPDGNFRHDVYVYDREKGTTEIVSVSDSGERGNNAAGFYVDMSRDGRYVAFSSNASNFVPRDTNPSYNVYLRDRAARRTFIVTVSSEGVVANNSAQQLAVSDDGRYVAYAGSATNLVSDDTNDLPDVFVHDLVTGGTERVSVADDGSEARGGRYVQGPDISGDGRYVAFYGDPPNLGPGDDNAGADVFVRDRGPDVGVGALDAVRRAGDVTVSGWATFGGGPIASVTDAPDDGGPGARDLRGELVGAELRYQVEHEQLLVRVLSAKLGVADPTLLGWVATPATLHLLTFRAGASRWEVRAAPPTVYGPASPFTLYRCAAECVQVSTVDGAFGGAGEELRFGLPLTDAGLAPGSVLTDVRAFTAVGVAATGSTRLLDEVRLPDVTIPAPGVSWDLRDERGRQVAGGPAPLHRGAFTEFIDARALPPGAYELTARACLAERCGARAATVVIDG